MIVIDDIYENLNFPCDGFIVHLTSLDTFPGKCFSLEEAIIEARKIKDLGKIAIASIDRVFEEDDLELLNFSMKVIIDNFDYIIYSDYAVIHNTESLDKFIYDPKTLVCSLEEAKTIDTKTFISLEQSSKEVDDIVNNLKSLNKVCYTIFGLRQMMYSRRMLLSIYNDFSSDVSFNKNIIYDLKEELRDDLYKIIENDNGTFIYTPYFYYNPLTSFSYDDLFICHINSYLLTEEDIRFLLLIYTDKANKEIRENKIKEYFGKRHLKISKGFLTDKLFLLKDKDNE